MADLLSMDLDSIIAANKAAKKPAAGGSGKGKGGSRGGNSGNNDRDRPARDQPKARGGQQAQASGSRQQQQQQQQQPKEALTTGSTDLSISNLDKGVTESDLKALFERTGKCKKVVLFYDKGGKSTGTAHVQMGSKQDAAAAMARYNNVTLDGRPMHIKVLMTAGAAMSAPAPRRQSPARTRDRPSGNAGSGSRTARPASGDGAARGGRGRGGRSGSGAGAGGKAERPAKQAPKSQEELDRELMDYMGSSAGDAMQTD